MTEIGTVAEDDGRRQVTVVDLKSLTGRLVSIDVAEVAPEVRAKLVRYPAECVEVPARHFSDRPAGEDPPLTTIRDVHRSADD